MAVSLYGSHSSMRCDFIEEDTVLGADLIIAGFVLLKDEKGNYPTHSSRLDDGLADVKRFNSVRRFPWKHLFSSALSRKSKT